MKKTNTRGIFFNKAWIGFGLVQIFIILLFMLCFYSSRPIDIDDCTKSQIAVEDKIYVRNIHEYTCRIFANGSRYDFPNIGHFGEYTTKEIYDNIEIGELLDVIVIEKNDLFGKYNLIVEAVNKNDQYLDFELYNVQKEMAFVSVIVLFSVLELVFLVLFGIYNYFKNISEIKSFFNKLNKKMSNKKDIE